MKAKVGKTVVSAKVQSKSAKKPAVQVNSLVNLPVKKAAAKRVGTSSGKPLLKAGNKPGTVSSAKSGARPPAKVSAKVGAKLAAKSGGKAPAKLPVKSPVGSPIKAPTKFPVDAVKPGASKAPSKPAVTIKNQKSAPKVAAKKVNTVLKTPSKPVPKPGIKPTVAKAGKELKTDAVKRAVVPASKVKPEAKTSADAGSAAKAPAAKTSEVKPVIKVATKAVLAPTPSAAPSTAVSPVAQAAPVPPKAGRPSSRLAQLTVPSMAQSVASTAAKSSFSQTTALPLIVPPLPSATKKDPKLANNWKTKPVEQLTDAELLSMPDAEYMNDKQMAVFRLKLSILKQDILNSASDTTEHLREDTVVVPDPADRATIEEEHALELRTRDRERKLLKKIEQSINRIDAGDYGYCDETGEPIGVGRLLARPTATLSLEAQQRRELKQKMFGD